MLRVHLPRPELRLPPVRTYPPSRCVDPRVRCARPGAVERKFVRRLPTPGAAARGLSGGACLPSGTARAAAMTDFLQLVFSGMATGSIYALAALGFTLLWQASGT